MSSIDALTGIFNRRAFFERAVEATERTGAAADRTCSSSKTPSANSDQRA